MESTVLGLELSLHLLRLVNESPSFLRRGSKRRLGNSSAYRIILQLRLGLHYLRDSYIIQLVACILPLVDQALAL